MLIYEYKLDGSKHTYAAIDEAIRITQFIGKGLSEGRTAA
jgi:hypothetical protein